MSGTHERKTSLYRLYRLSGVFLTFGLFVCVTASVSGASNGSHACCEPNIWVFSTRYLPGICCMPEVVNPTVQRYEPEDCRWLSDDVGSLLSGKDPLSFFYMEIDMTHGRQNNRVSVLQSVVVSSRPIRWTHS